jgi:hypothetical protein
MPSLNSPSIAQLRILSIDLPQGLGAEALPGTSQFVSAGDHVHQIPAITGDVISDAGSTATTVVKIQGRNVSAATPLEGQSLVWSTTVSAWVPGSAGAPGGGQGAAAAVRISSNFKGDGVTLVFSPVAGIATAEAYNCTVAVGGMIQTPYSSFTIDPAGAGTLTFDEAPPTGVDIIIDAYR